MSSAELRIVKRNGATVPFSIEKIKNAVRKAFLSVGTFATEEDLTNILARVKALEYLREHRLDEVRCAISCCIGRPEIRVSFFDKADKLLETHVESEPPSHVVDLLGLREPGYAQACMEGLFGNE